MSIVRRVPLLLMLIIGLGLVAAPIIFQMYERAPKGADMIDDFRPYMTDEQIDLFQGYLVEIDAANTESIDPLQASLIASGAITAAEYENSFLSVAKLNDDWPAIQEDMDDLLGRMENNLDNYAAVDAMPNFKLYPWFFLVTGGMIAGLAGWGLWSERNGGGLHRWLIWGIIGIGLAVALSPVVFQMFTRAPQGGDMIDDFRPMMTRERVQDIQGYFITIGAAEAELRAGVLPFAAEVQGSTPDELAADYPAIAEFSADWPEIVSEFGAMIAVMSDNVDNFEAVDALPPFKMFPFFFLIPGALVAGIGIWSLRHAKPVPGNVEDEDEGEDEPSAPESAPRTEDLITEGKP